MQGKYLTCRVAKPFGWNTTPNEYFTMRMNKCYLFLLFTLQITFSFAQNWEWATRSGGANQDINRDITLDSDKNVYTCGFFNDTSIFGTDTVVAAQWEDLYLAKYDSLGNYQWVFTAGAGFNNEAKAISADNFGNVYIVGTVEDSTDFSTDTVNDRVKGAFLAKFNSNGSLIWVKNLSANLTCYYHDIVCDESGNILIIGRFLSTATFDSITLVPYGSYDAFVAKYDSSGTLIWINHMGSSGSDWLLSVASDDQNNCYITGFASDTLYIGNDTFPVPGGSSVYVTSKLDSSGTYVWHNTMLTGFVGSIAPNKVSTDNNGNCYLTGGYMGTVVMGDTLPVPLNSDVFVAKINAAGSFEWSRGFGGLGVNNGLGIAVDEQGNSFFCGSFSQEIIFDSLVLTAPFQFGSYGFLAKLDMLGSVKWARFTADSGSASSNNVELDGDGGVYIGGLTFDTAYFNSTMLVSNGMADELVAKLGDVVSNDLVMGNVTTNVSCSGLCNGLASVMVSGGTPPYDYSWSDPAFQTTATATGLCSGIYQVIVADSSGLSDSITVTITEPDNLVVDLSPDTSICFGDSAELLLSVAGGVNPIVISPQAWCMFGPPCFKAPDSTTVYTITATDSNGCTASDTVVITVYPPLNASVLSSDDTICEGGSSVLNASASGGEPTLLYSYFWPHNGSSNSQVTVSPTATTTYQVIVNDGCSLGDTASVTINVTPCTGLNYPGFYTYITINPNPNSGVFSMVINTTQDLELGIRITNHIGQVMYQDELEIKPGTYERLFDFSEYSSGIYNIQFMSDTKVINKKIIIGK